MDKPSSIMVYNLLKSAIEERHTLETVTMLYASYVLASHGWNKSRASKTLGVARRTLHRWEANCYKLLEAVHFPESTR